MTAPFPAPRDAHLSSLQEWAIRQKLPAGLLRSIVSEALLEGGCQRAEDAEHYSRYLDALLTGRHDIALLDHLSLPALQLGGQVLLAWRTWLQSNTLPPSSLEAILLDCLAAIQAHAKPRQWTGDDLDHATGLPGRHALPAALAQAGQRTEQGRISALLYIEISSVPHIYPDTLLRVLAQRLSGMLRNQDTLLLIDRQTFGLVLANLNGEGHALLAGHRALKCFEDAILIQGSQAIQLHPRIGVALAPEHGETAKQLFEAGAAAARMHSSESVTIYDPGQDKLTFVLNRLEIPFREALEHNHFHLVFQPQIFNRKLGLYGMESLLRWENEQLGQVPPGQIVTVAEHLGLMPALTQWVLNASLREFAKLAQAGIPGSISINVAPSNLLDREFASVLSDALALWQVPAQRVVLEITESALIDHPDTALESMQNLKRLGCKLALDDFGTGYSSLSYLKRLPIDELKIDRSFILTMLESPKDAGIVRTIIELSHLLGLVVVTEGVEDAETVRLLAQMGNDVIQGFFFSKPLRPESIPAYVSAMKQWGTKPS